MLRTALVGPFRYALRFASLNHQNGRFTMAVYPKTDKFACATIPSGGGLVRNMAATADGRVYIACSGVNKVGVVERVR